MMLHLIDAALSIAMECLHCDASSDRCCLVSSQQSNLLQRSLKNVRRQARLETVPCSLLRVQTGLAVFACWFFQQLCSFSNA